MNNFSRPPDGLGVGVIRLNSTSDAIMTAPLQQTNVSGHVV